MEEREWARGNREKGGRDGRTKGGNHLPSDYGDAGYAIARTPARASRCLKARKAPSVTRGRPRLLTLSLSFPIGTTRKSTCNRSLGSRAPSAGTAAHARPPSQRFASTNMAPASDVISRRPHRSRPSGGRRASMTSAGRRACAAAGPGPRRRLRRGGGGLCPQLPSRGGRGGMV